MTAAELAQQLNAKRNGSGWQAKCPAHDDRVPSLSISQGKDGQVLLYCHAGCAIGDIVASIGLTKKDLSRPDRTRRLTANRYDYTDEKGNLLFQVCRFLPKDFRQRRPDGNGGWIDNTRGVRRVLYQLPKVIAAQTVAIAEGEKDCDSLTKAGMIATCNPGGAGKWRNEYSETLRGKDIVIFGDDDEPGRAHVRQIKESLAGRAHSIKSVALPFPFHDVSDFIASLEPDAVLDALQEQIKRWTPIPPLVRDWQENSAQEFQDFIKTAPPPDLGSLLQRTADALNQFITFSEDYAVVCAVWVAHTHCIQYFPYTPYVSITSPTKRCGKSNLLTALKYLCARGWYAIAPSVAVLFRKIERDMPTLLLDESDRCLKDAEESKQELLSILNSGYKRGATVDRCGGANKTDLESFHVFCPKAFAGIGDLPDTIADRCLSIRMQRQKAGSKHFYEDEVEADLSPIRDGFEKWAATPGLGDQLNFKIAKTDFPDSLSDRSREACEPLYRIAKLAGGGWLDRIKKATAAICAGQEDQDKSVELLSVIRDIFGNADKLSSHDLINGILELENPPVPDWWFKKDVGMKAMGKCLAKTLKKFGLQPGLMRIDGSDPVKGYQRSDFEPVWSAYCPSSPNRLLEVTKVTPEANLPSM
jgi:hypothetical protein